MLHETQLSRHQYLWAEAVSLYIEDACAVAQGIATDPEQLEAFDDLHGSQELLGHLCGYGDLDPEAVAGALVKRLDTLEEMAA